MHAGISYVFALFSSVAFGPPPPSPSPTPVASSGNLGAVIIDFDPTSYVSPTLACMQITLNGTPYMNISGQNGWNFTAPAGANQTLGMQVYASASCTGTPVDVGNSSVSIVAGITTTVTVKFYGIMTSFTAALNPQTVTVGTASDMQITITPRDASNFVINSPNYYDTTLHVPTFAAVANDTTGHTLVTANPTTALAGTLHYDGSGTGPSTVTVTTGALQASTAPLQYAAVHNVWAYVDSDPSYVVSLPGTLEYLPAGATQPLWTQTLQGGNILVGSQAAFDASGNIWVNSGTTMVNGTLIAPLYGYRQDGSLVGTITLPGSGGNLVAFDVNGHLYVNNGTSILMYSVNASDVATLISTITPPAQPCSAAVDARGDLYISTCLSTSNVAAIYEYPAGSTSFSTYLFGNYPQVSTDQAGNLYAVSIAGTISKWPAGGFPTATPVTIPFVQIISTFAVQPWGDICAFYGQGKSNEAAVGYSASGSTVPVCPAASYYFGSIAAPIR